MKNETEMKCVYFFVLVLVQVATRVLPVYVTLDTRIRAHSLYREGTLYLFMSSCSAYCSIL